MASPFIISSQGSGEATASSTNTITFGNAFSAIQTGDLIYVGVAIDGSLTPTGISGTGFPALAKRANGQFLTSGECAATTWSAVATAPATGFSLTATFGSNFDDCAVVWAIIRGAVSGAPFDPYVALPYVKAGASPATTTVTYATANADDLLLCLAFGENALYRDPSVFGQQITPWPPWEFTTGAGNSGGGGFCGAVLYQLPVSATQVGATVGSFIPFSTATVFIVDALTADAPVVLPGIPIDESCGPSTTTSITPTWAPGPGTTPASYTLQWRPPGGGAWTQIAGIAGTSQQITGLSPGTTYEWQVEAVATATLDSIMLDSSGTSESVGGTTTSIVLNTGSAGDFIALAAVVGTPLSPLVTIEPTLTIASAGGLTWTPRGNAGGQAFFNSRGVGLQVWTAEAPAALSNTTIEIGINCTIDAAGAVYLAYSGVGSLDPNSALPAQVFMTDNPGTGDTLPQATISTTNSADLVLEFIGSNQDVLSFSPPSTFAPSGAAAAPPVVLNDAGEYWAYLGAVTYPAPSPLTDTVVGFSSPTAANWALVGLALSGTQQTLNSGFSPSFFCSTSPGFPPVGPPQTLAALAKGILVVGDYQNGNLYLLDRDQPTDNGTQRKWLRTWRATQRASVKPMRFPALVISLETGSQVPDGTNPQIQLRFSDDGGHTWSSTIFEPAGKTGQTAFQVKFRRLGSTRVGQGLDRILELSSTDAFKVALIGADWDEVAPQQ